jgi:hypothetical protein
MLYLMLIYNDDAKMGAATPEEQEAIGKGYEDFNAFLADSGALRGTATWPAGITTVRSLNGRTETSDKPFDGSGQGVSGFLLVEAGTIEEAVKIAERVPATRYGAVEIRPVQGP